MAIELEPWFSVMPLSDPTMTLVRTLLEYPETYDNVVVRIRKTPLGFIVNDGGPLAKYTGIATMRRRCPGFNAWVERLLTSVGLVVQHHRTICQNFLALQQVIQTISVFAFQRAVEFLMPQMKAR